MPDVEAEPSWTIEHRPVHRLGLGGKHLRHQHHLRVHERGVRPPFQLPIQQRQGLAHG